MGKVEKTAQDGIIGAVKDQAYRRLRMNKPPRFGGEPGQPVPPVDPEDLKAVWRVYSEGSSGSASRHFLAAQIKMEWIGRGVGRQGLPFDVDEFFQRVRDKSAEQDNRSRSSPSAVTCC